MNDQSRSVFSRVILNAGTLLSSRVFKALCSFLYIKWTAQTLGLELLGVMFLITTYIDVIYYCFCLQSWQPLLHYGTKYFEEKKYHRFHQILGFCIRTDLISGVFSVVIGIIGIILGAYFLKWDHQTTFYALCAMPIILFRSTGWSSGVFKISDKFNLTARCENFGTIVRITGVGIGAIYHATLSYFLFIWCLTIFVIYCASTFYGFSLIKKRTGHYFIPQTIVNAPKNAKAMWKHTFKTSFNETLHVIFTGLVTLVVGSDIGAEEAAVYKVASQISNGIAKPVHLMIPALYPEFIKMRNASNYEGIVYVIRRIFLVIIGFSILAIILTALFGSPLLSYMLHYSWPQQKIILLLLVGGALLDICLCPIEPYLVMLNKVSILLNRRILIIIGYFLLFPLFSNHFHVVGVATEILLASMILFVTCFIPVVRDLNRRMRVHQRNQNNGRPHE